MLLYLMMVLTIGPLYSVQSSSLSHSHFISNNTITGHTIGCLHKTTYVVNHMSQFQMCTGQSHADLKNGMSIINLVTSRGYLPTCRIMQLMLWMYSEVSHHSRISRENYFIDVGANIGSCSVLMAAMGFPVIAVEPVLQHVNTILGSVAINPYFHLEIFHMGSIIIRYSILLLIYSMTSNYPRRDIGSRTYC